MVTLSGDARRKTKPTCDVCGIEHVKIRKLKKQSLCPVCYRRVVEGRLVE
jgi:predicted Zn-ribbon and HTH transcriptional regulator